MRKREPNARSCYRVTNNVVGSNASQKRTPVSCLRPVRHHDLPAADAFLHPLLRQPFQSHGPTIPVLPIALPQQISTSPTLHQPSQHSPRTLSPSPEPSVPLHRPGELSASRPAAGHVPGGNGVGVCCEDRRRVGKCRAKRSVNMFATATA